MYKIISSFLILTAGGISAFGINKNYKKQSEIIKDISELFEYIKNQIFYFNTPSEIILKNCKSRLVNCFDFSKDDYGIKDCRKIDFLPEKEKKAVYDFFNSFGKTTREEELKICDYSIGIIEKYKENREQNERKKINGYSCLCMIFGILFVILII